MPASELKARPFVETGVARHLLSRLRVIHEDRGIAVISGPWGIGKTTAINEFTRERDGESVVVKIEPGTSKSGASPVAVMQAVVKALAPWVRHSSHLPVISTAYWKMKLLVGTYIEQMHGFDAGELIETPPLLTLIFDEAQYLSPASIEMLRYWNDDDRTVTPFPLGLAFVGNNEFSLEDSRSGQSVISGAVRSRALFIEALDYLDITDADITLFLHSREVRDSAAVASVVAYYNGARVKRDLRNVERMIETLKRRAGDHPVTGEIVRSFLNPV